MEAMQGDTGDVKGMLKYTAVYVRTTEYVGVWGNIWRYNRI